MSVPTDTTHGRAPTLHHMTDPGPDPRPAPRSFAEAGVVELRRYTLRPGALPDLLELFETHLVAAQEEQGMLVGGVFEDVEQPDRFVWWRAFTDLESRHRALVGFYGGAVWAEHSRRANATMIDSDDVLMLRHTAPPRPGPPARSLTTVHDDAVAVLICRGPDVRDAEARLTAETRRWLESVLGVEVATWRTEPAPNSFPGLPVRTEPAFVYAATFADAAERDAALTALRAEPGWTRWLKETTSEHSWELEILRLRPLTVSKHPAPRRPMFEA